MSANCPANDTDCLLRALVDANSGYNWNPLNFAFTAALSILGFVVAIVTLIQGLLAAGPGRLKASRSAVGYAYSQNALTRFDRTELRFRTLVRVPVLDIARLLGPEKISVRNGGSKIRTWRGRNVEAFPGEVSRSLAGWSRLLEDLGLEDFDFATLSCATDYLPGDIQAAPAYASVESLVIMALLAGCENIQPAETFLRATGPNLQLEFRPHQTLGVVAAYQHYFSTEERDIDNSAHSETIHEALGHIKYGGDPIFKLNFRSIQHGDTANVEMNYEILTEAIDRQRSECDHPGCASRTETVESWTAFLTDEKPNQSEIDKLTTLLFADKPTTARMFPTAATDFRRLLNDIGNRKYKDTWFHQSTVAQDLASLPESEALVDIKRIDEVEALSKPQNQSRDDSSWFMNTKYLSMKHEGLMLANFLPQDTNDQISSLRAMAAKAFHAMSAETKVLEQDSIIVSDQALSTCFLWLANSELFATMDWPIRAETREYLMLQLREVDYWLSRHGGSDALCAALNMIKDLHVTAPVEEEVENLSKPDGDSNHHNDEPKKRKGKPVADSRTYEANEDRPTWIRCNRKWLAPETVNHYNLPWEFDRRDPAYLIIKEWIPEDFQAELFEHTKKIPAQEEKEHMTDVSDARGDHLYRVRKGGKWSKPLSSTTAKTFSGDGTQTSRRWSTRTERVRGAGSKDPNNVRESQHGQTRPEISADLESLDRDTARERGSGRDESGRTESQGKVDIPQTTVLVETSERLLHPSVPSRRSSRHTNKTTATRSSEASEHKERSRMNAMETMLLYRAILFACLLATGTDTSELLWLENRNRIVQVL